MKTLFFAAAIAAVLTFPALAQKYTCFADAELHTIKLNGGAIWSMSFYMPFEGTCAGTFASHNDRSDAWAAAQKHYGLGDRSGDVEIMILDAQEFEDFCGFGSHTAHYSSDRSAGGTFTVKLAPGWYKLVVNNRGSLLAGKGVKLTFGEPGSPPSAKYIPHNAAQRAKQKMVMRVMAGVPADATAKCKDGFVTQTVKKSAQCSRHGGVDIRY